MKQILKLLDFIALFAIPVIAIAVIFYLPDAKHWKPLLLIDVGIIIFWLIQWIRFHNLQLTWETMLQIYYTTWDRESEPPNDTIAIDEVTRNMIPTFTNVFIKKKEVTEYMECKLLLYHIENTVQNATIS